MLINGLNITEMDALVYRYAIYVSVDDTVDDVLHSTASDYQTAEQEYYRVVLTISNSLEINGYDRHVRVRLYDYDKNANIKTYDSIEDRT